MVLTIIAVNSQTLCCVCLCICSCMKLCVFFPPHIHSCSWCTVYHYIRCGNDWGQDVRAQGYVDRALTSLRLRSKSKLGSRCNSSKSLDYLSVTPTLPTPPTLRLQRSVSSGEHSLGDEEESPPFPVKKAKPPFIVLVSTLSRDEGMQSKVPWNAECDFRLEEVCTFICMD